MVPKELQGRMNATMRFIVTGAIPIGSLLGGILGQILGFRATVGISLLGGSLAFLWVLFSPVRKVREFPGSNTSLPDPLQGQTPHQA